MVHPPREQRGHGLQGDVRVRGRDDYGLRWGGPRAGVIAAHERAHPVGLATRQRASRVLAMGDLSVVCGPGRQYGAAHA